MATKQKQERSIAQAVLEKGMRMENLINKFRIGFYSVMFLVDMAVIFGFGESDFGEFSAEAGISTAILLAAWAGYCYWVHKATSSPPYPTYVPYATIGVDMLSTLIVFAELSRNQEIEGLPLPLTDMIFLISIQLMLINSLSVFRYNLNSILYSVALSVLVNTVNWFIIGSLKEGWVYTSCFLIIFGGFNYWAGKYVIQQLILQRKLGDTLSELEESKRESERLLLNILPEETAEELKAKGSSTPRQYDSATVLFSDFVGFTQLAEELSPKELVESLHELFSSFDDAVVEYGLEKIKTIGDAYMCAGGIPNPNGNHATNAIRVALKMLEVMDNWNRNRKNPWQLRIGIHTGPLVAGVTGKHKFAYDVWGDTVNIAARMESSGEASRINISESTHDLIKEHFTCEYRGKVAAKNKGELGMYFVS